MTRTTGERALSLAFSWLTEWAQEVEDGSLLIVVDRAGDLVDA